MMTLLSSKHYIVETGSLTERQHRCNMRPVASSVWYAYR